MEDSRIASVYGRMKRVLFALLLHATIVGANVIPAGPSAELLIPAAGSAPGANGTYFRSDITIVNLALHDQQVVLLWLPQGRSGSTRAIVTIPAEGSIHSADFVHDYFGETGIGAIVVAAYLSYPAEPAFDAQLYALSRIWTPQPGTNGTTSQSFPAIPATAVVNTGSALLFIGGQDQPEKYRVNVGVVNMDANNAQTFSMQPGPSGGILPAPPPFLVTVPAMSMQQIAFGPPGRDFFDLAITNITPDATRSPLWTAYGSTVDNITGDAWSEIAVPLSP